MSFNVQAPLHVRSGAFELGPVPIGTVEPGVTLVAGDNGCGKSTLFRELDRTARAEGRRIAFLPQTFTFPPFARVLDVCRFVAERRIDEREQRGAAIEEALVRTGLTEQAQSSTRRLSGGMHRRLGICLTVIGDPEVVVLDEPSTGLDVSQRRGLREVIRAVARTTPVLMSTHIVDDIDVLADRVLLLRDGKAVFDGSSGEFLGHADGDAERPWESAYERLLASSVEEVS